MLHVFKLFSESLYLSIADLLLFPFAVNLDVKHSNVFSKAIHKGVILAYLHLKVVIFSLHLPQPVYRGRNLPLLVNYLSFEPIVVRFDVSHSINLTPHLVILIGAPMQIFFRSGGLVQHLSQRFDFFFGSECA